MESEFKYTHINSGSSDIEVSWDIRIPLSNSNCREVAHQIINQYNLPFFAEKDLLLALEDYLKKEVEKYYDKKSAELLKSQNNNDPLSEQWSIWYQEECSKYRPSSLTVEQTSDGPTFAEMYHSLIHSAALETMLNLEHTYAISVEDLVCERDQKIEEIQRKQSKEMEEAVGKVGIQYTDRDINDMAARHFHESQELTEKWENKIGTIKQLQKKEFREWITKVHEDYKSGCGSPGYLQRVRAMSEFSSPNDGADDWQPLQSSRMEESFTIHLGSQLKVTHNLRLLSADILDLCKHKANKVGGVLFPQPQRLQTAMSLYSNALCGLVLLVDNRINSYTGIKRDFASVCQKSTELHFPDIQEQLESVRNQSLNINKLQQQEMVSEVWYKFLKWTGNQFTKKPHGRILRPGDFYVTKHSNLSEVHVVFHLVGDDSLLSSDINSRHPVILGLRNVLRVAHERDVGSITLPLLLVQDMAEGLEIQLREPWKAWKWPGILGLKPVRTLTIAQVEMTIPWCLKRAELVFKCIKGFMIEMASLTGEETRTVQFMVPKGISDEFFGNLSTMLPSIFRVSNPLILK